MIDVDVRDLVAHPGASRPYRLAEPVPGLRLELAGVPDDAPVEGDLLLESVVEGILVSGPISSTVRLTCARCLEEFEGRVDVAVQELYVRPPGEGEDEYRMSPEGSLDLEPMVRDTVMLALPFSPLCRPDCLGLCERCGGDRNLGACTCREPLADPRWAALDVLFDDTSRTTD
ncbi:MAG TPA: YceD family protein [Actinomycetota bacterium]